MKKRSTPALFKSFDQISILRKLTIVYFLASVLPVGLLYYVYWHIKNKGRFEITETRFAVILMLVIGAVWLGYWVLRSMMTGVVRLAEEQRRRLALLLGGDFDATDEIQSEYDELRILEACFAESSRQLEHHIKHLQRTRQALRGLITKISRGLNRLENIDDFLELILMTLTEALDLKGGVLLEHTPLSNKWSVVGAVGEAVDHRDWIPSNDHPLVRTVLESTGPVGWTPPADTDDPTARWPTPVLACGLRVHESCLGMMVLMGRSQGRRFMKDDYELVHHICLQTAVAMETASLQENTERTYLETLTALALAVEAKEPYARGHGRRVAELCDEIARHFELSDDDRRLLHEAALLHDIGKIGVSDELLNRPPPLTEEEMELIKKHVIIGEGMVAPLKHLGPIGKIIRRHHERLDGSGYPDGLKGDQIPLTVRILTVADIYDALTSVKPERGPLSPQEALARLKAMGGQVDSKVVEVLAQTIEGQPSA